MNEEIVTQMGLIFSQMRYMRRALESIERNTAQYRGVTFAAAVAEGARFGEPPLFEGALKVYVVNINELNAGGGLGIFEVLFGAAGRFLGNLFSGVVGGTIGSIALPFTFSDLRRTAEAVDRILGRLGVTGGPSPPESGPSTLIGQIEALTSLVQALEKMFKAASDEPAKGTGKEELTPNQFPWHQTLPILQTLSHVVDGLILLIPNLTGAFLTFLNSIDTLKFRIVDLLSFAVRNLLLLRGVVVVTLFDTLGAAATLGANLLRIVSGQLDAILSGIIGAVKAMAKGVVEVIRFFGPALATTLNAILVFLRDGLGNALIGIGNTNIFRLIFHVVNALPSILPGLIELRTGAAPSSASITALASAPAFSAATAPYLAPLTKIKTFPNVADPFSKAAVTTMLSELDTQGATLRTEAASAASAGETLLKDVGKTLNEAVTTGEGNFRAQLETNLAGVTASAKSFTEAAVAAQAAAPKGDDDSPISQIARAYTDWLTSGGFKELIGRITTHFEKSPAIPKEIVKGAARPEDGPGVAIESIDIILRAPAEGDKPASGPTSQADDFPHEKDDLIVRPYRGRDPSPIGGSEHA